MVRSSTRRRDWKLKRAVWGLLDAWLELSRGGSRYHLGFLVRVWWMVRRMISIKRRFDWISRGSDMKYQELES